jgi:DNA-binding NtrC family response regulator
VRARIQEALEETGGNISRTAVILGISRNTLRAHLDKLRAEGRLPADLA